jgi:homeobox protein cut-like
LHLLVFIMLYWMGSTDVARSVPNLSDAVPAAAAGPLAAAGDALGGGGDAGEWHQEAPPGG